MNQLNTYVLGIYQVAMIVRDTLEYTLKQQSYNVQAYEQRQKGLDILLADGAPLANFIKNNEEKASVIMDNLRKFQDSIYGPESTIVVKAHDGLRIDHNQHIQIYEQVIGIYQTLIDILYGYMQHAEKNEAADQEVIQLFKLDEHYFRVYSHLVIIHDLMQSFTEFNRVIRENNGQPGPLSNFVIEDMKKLNGYLYFQKKHNRVKDAHYNELVDSCFAFVENMEGKRALPEGKNFPDVHKEITADLLKELGDVEVKWKQQYQKVMNDAIATTKKAQAEAKMKKDSLS